MRRPRFAIDDLLSEIGRRGRVPPRAAPFLWGFGGFLIGAIFWYAAGVWSFLGAVAVREPGTVIAVRQEPAEPAALPNCITLMLYRATGRTVSVPCPEDLPLLQEAAVGRRDLASVERR